MPLYSITMPLMFFVGLTALLVLPGLSSGDLSMLMMVRKTFPAWFLGIVGGAGALTAMVPAAILLLTASTLFAKNICRPILAPKMTDSQVAKLAKITVLVVTAAAVCSAIYSSTTLVSLLLLGYAGVAQFLPGVLLGLYSRRMTMFPILAGLLTGSFLVSFLMLSKRDPFMGLNAGFVGLCVNFAVVGIMHLLVASRRGNSSKESVATPPAQ